MIMKLNSQHTFLEQRLQQENEFFSNLTHADIMHSLSSVDVTTIDLCNRTCVFCPRHDPRVYPNRNLRMTKEGAEIISKKLNDIQYRGTIAISGFGENLLNPEIIDIVRAFRTYNKDCYIECNTNGDPLNSSLAKSLIEAGLTCLNINLYDGPEQVDKYELMLKELPINSYKYRVHWNPDDYGIIFNNRSGMITWMNEPVDDDIKNKPCYYPFYKMMVDWNGDVLFCANDWGRTRVVGNLLQQSVSEVWLSKHMKKIRMRLANADRNFKPCSTCSVNGVLVGKKSFDLLMENYNASSNNGNK